MLNRAVSKSIPHRLSTGALSIRDGGPKHKGGPDEPPRPRPAGRRVPPAARRQPRRRFCQRTPRPSPPHAAHGGNSHASQASMPTPTGIRYGGGAAAGWSRAASPGSSWTSPTTTFLARNFERYCDLSPGGVRRPRLPDPPRPSRPAAAAPGALVPRIVAEDWLVSYRWPRGWSARSPASGGGSRASRGEPSRSGPAMARSRPTSTNSTRSSRVSRPACRVPGPGISPDFAKGTGAPAGPHPYAPRPVVF